MGCSADSLGPAYMRTSISQTPFCAVPGSKASVNLCRRIRVISEIRREEGGCLMSSVCPFSKSRRLAVALVYIFF